MSEEKETKHEWETVGVEDDEYVYVEECTRCGGRRRISSMFGTIVEEEPKVLRGTARIQADLTVRGRFL